MWAATELRLGVERRVPVGGCDGDVSSHDLCRAPASKVGGVMNAAVSVDSSSAEKFSVRGGLGTDGET